MQSSVAIILTLTLSHCYSAAPSRANGALRRADVTLSCRYANDDKDAAEGRHTSQVWAHAVLRDALERPPQDNVLGGTHGGGVAGSEWNAEADLWCIVSGRHVPKELTVTLQGRRSTQALYRASKQGRHVTGFWIPSQVWTTLLAADPANNDVQHLNIVIKSGATHVTHGTFYVSFGE